MAPSSGHEISLKNSIEETDKFSMKPIKDYFCLNSISKASKTDSSSQIYSKMVHLLLNIKIFVKIAVKPKLAAPLIVIVTCVTCAIAEVTEEFDWKGYFYNLIDSNNLMNIEYIFDMLWFLDG